jgi:hypothetical protein
MNNKLRGHKGLVRKVYREGQDKSGTLETVGFGQALFVGFEEATDV